MAGFRTFTAGEVLTAANVNTYFLQQAFAYKTADESITSSATLQNDDHLSISISASTNYIGAVALLATAGNAAGDIHVAFSFPASCVLHYLGIGVDPAIASGSKADLENLARHTATSGSTDISYGLSAGVHGIYLPFIVLNSTNAGTVQFMWAQQTSNGTATTVKSGSYMYLQRVS